MTRKFHIKTYGCQMNVYDSARMADVLTELGYLCVDGPEQADLIILNTCHIREKAAEKVYSELGRLRPLKARPAADGGPVRLAVAGCVAQAEGEEMIARAPFVDLVFGPQTCHRLPQMIRHLDAGGACLVDTEFPVEDKFDHLPEARVALSAVTAFLTVQEGCDRFCTFCVVPYTRGAEASRPAQAVLAEARRLVAAGVREVTLLGQNVNAYHGAAGDGGEWDLARLIRELAGLGGLQRIRYTTSHPADMTDALIAAHGEVESLMPFLHLPVQSGSDRILQAMNRRHRACDYRRIVDRLRAARPDVALSSDFIVGFPGETDEDFQATLDLIDDIGFAQAFSFKYSPRPGTPAADWPQVDDAVKAGRLAVLQAALDRHQRRFNESCVGRTLPVLFDSRGRRPGQLCGRSPYLQPVHARLPDSAIGEILAVTIREVHANSLAAEPDGQVAA